MRGCAGRDATILSHTISKKINITVANATYHLGPSEAAAITQVTLPAWSSPPLRGDFGVAIGAVFGRVSILSPFSLLLGCYQRLHFLGQHTIPLFQLPDLVLPRARLGRFQLIKQVIIGR